MSRKEISEPYKIFTSGVMSGTGTITSSATGVLYRDTVGIQLQWTGNPVGTFTVQGSLDYNPGIPQSAGSLNAGQWFTLPFSNSAGAIVTSITIGSGSAQPVGIGIEQIPSAWVQTVYTNSSGSGLLTGYVLAKSLG